MNVVVVKSYSYIKKTLSNQQKDIVKLKFANQIKNLKNQEN